jgi:hypothetical protein
MMGKSMADGRCRDVGSSLGTMVDIQFHMGLTPLTNRVHGLVRCATETGKHLGTPIELPIWFCPDNMLVGGSDVVRDLVDDFCAPLGSLGRYGDMILVDTIGNPSFVRESDILNSVSWKSGDGGRSIRITAAYNKGNSNLNLRDPVWVPLKVAGLSRDLVIFVKPGFLVSIGLGRSPPVTATHVGQLMGIHAKVSRSLTVKDGEITYQVTEIRSGVDTMNLVRILRVAEFVDSQVCPICLEPAGNMETEVCGHSFHPKCISSWIRSNPSCPVCRSPIVS